MHLHELAVGDFIFGFGVPSEMPVAGGGFVSSGIADSQMHVKRLTNHPRKWRKDKIEIEYFQIDFRWIPWVRGKINWCSPAGTDVASGWFSGCWMVRYRDNGNWRVGHVTADAEGAFDCKADWRTHKALATTDNVTEFSPYASVGLGSSRMGIVTSTGDLYALGVNAAKITVPNPYGDPAYWQGQYAGLSLKAATKMAREKEMDSSGIYPGTLAYEVAAITGPLVTQAFPP